MFSFLFSSFTDLAPRFNLEKKEDRQTKDGRVNRMEKDWFKVQVRFPFLVWFESFDQVICNCVKS